MAEEPKTFDNTLQLIERALSALTRGPSAARLNGYFEVSSSPGLDRPAYATLVVLSDMGPLRASELADACAVHGSTMSRITDRLVETGLVEPLLDPSDRRGVLLRVSAKGKRRVKQIQEARRLALARMLLPWQEEDQRQLARLLTNLVDQIDQAAREKPPEARRRKTSRLEASSGSANAHRL